MILQQRMTGTVIGSLPGLPGNGRRISFRILHVFEFRNGLISRENVWLDSAAIVKQLSRRSPRDGKSLSDSVTAGGKLVSHPRSERARQLTMIRGLAVGAAAPRGLRG